MPEPPLRLGRLSAGPVVPHHDLDTPEVADVITAWLLGAVSAVYMIAALFAPSPNDFVNCCVVGYLAARTAGYWWEDSE
jgi:hypothetical protein